MPNQKTRDIDTMLGQRHRRWTNIGPTLGRCRMFAHAGKCGDLHRGNAGNITPEHNKARQNTVTAKVVTTITVFYLRTTAFMH